MAIGHKDIDLTKEELEAALEDLWHRVAIDTCFDIPYVGGYNWEGDVIYIDKDLPDTITIKGKEYDVCDFLMVHEATEKALIDKFHISYKMAHELADAAEWEVLETITGLEDEDLKEYDEFFEKWEKICRDKEDLCVPRNLDLGPYREDDELFERILAAEQGEE